MHLNGNYKKTSLQLQHELATSKSASMGMPEDELPELLGGRLGLDFVNTIHHRYRESSRDYLQDYRRWLDWSVHAGALGIGEARALERVAAAEPRLAGRAFERTLAFRSTAYDILQARLMRSAPDPASVWHLNEMLVVAAPLRLIEPGEAGRWSWAWSNRTMSLDRPLCAVAVSLSELLATAPSGRIKECPAPDGCGWFFLDETRNGSRRWCSMSHCGTSSKMRRYYRRRRDLEAE